MPAQNDYVSLIFNGLWNSVWMSLISIFIALIPGWIIVLGKTGKNPVLKILSSLYTLIFDGIPFLVQLYLAFFIIPQALNIYMSEVFIAILLLSLNASADIAKYAMLYLKNRENININTSMKITLIAFVAEFGEVMKLTTLVSSIGLIELFRVGKQITSVTGDTSVICVVAAIYIVISIIIKIATYFLGKKLFPQSK